MLTLRPMWEIRHGDCLELMRAMPDNSVDAVVTDPPYGLSFMGKKWDYDVPSPEVWAEALRVLKPGGHLLAFAGTRTQHRMAVRIEDAGFEIRDMIAWVYGSGFPKSLDVSKAIDKAAGAEREVVGSGKGRTGAAAQPNGGSSFSDDSYQWPGDYDITAPATDAARQWQGWGTALKPSTEPLTLARKPLDWRGLCLSLAQQITSQLCQYGASVKDAGPSSTSSPSASSAGQSGSVLWTAVEGFNTPGDLFALMDTLPSGSEIPTTLSTALSWLRTLDGLLEHESMFTTETASSLTTDLRTLNCLLSTSTPSTIIADLTEPSGRGSSAELVASIFNACDASLKSTLARSAHESVIARARDHYLDAGASPAMEPITVARKPLEGTVAQNVLEHGTGALNIDGCRVATDGRPHLQSTGRDPMGNAFGARLNGSRADGTTTQGRWPANLIHDGSEEAVGLFPQTAKSSATLHPGTNRGSQFGQIVSSARTTGYSDTGSAARFFYCAKASKADRDEGLSNPATPFVQFQTANGTSGRPSSLSEGRNTEYRNHHPTVKPTDLMRYLCRLVTPPGGTVLDPFTGSGSTGRGAVLEGFNFIGIEREAEYVPIAEARIAEAQKSLGLFA